MAANDGNVRRFAIALSFPGEHKRFVKNVATHLAKELGLPQLAERLASVA